ncbi:ABC transporter permease [Leifsonia sp. Root112D2]|jgi:NitT/TauT family transport system permease protein|uniref:ABC transporter permease n=1 Tax=Leifsonia sp. Root112D2 TaxID=1736426 RepID=UPI000701BCE5|nr:ABC transporter permease [Leifsonia sp. Root112D2]KQV06323.1 ABC transporter permease [Leifsonia sp. Root112D2]
MRDDKLAKVLKWGATPAILVVLFVAWELGVKLFNVNPLILPAPTEIFAKLFRMLGTGSIWMDAQTTTIEAVVGFLIALVVGVITGVVLGKSPLLELSMRPLIVASQVVPKVALIPLFVIWFGFGISSKIIIAALMGFFPIMLNVQLGVRSVDPGQRDVMRSLNATRWQTFRHLELKSTLPYVFAGMEVGIVFSVIGAIVGEYLGGSSGLGYQLVNTLNQLDAPGLFAVILLLAALGLILYSLVTFAKRISIPWHESTNMTQ